MNTSRHHSKIKRVLAIGLSTAMLTIMAGVVAPASHAATCVPGPGADLTGCDLKGADLQKANLSGANLKNADLSGANLTSANLKDAKFEGTVAVGTNFTSANLSNARLSGTDFSQANFTNATFLNSGWLNSLYGGKTITFSGATIQGANLKFDYSSGLDSILSGNLIGRPKALKTGWKVVKGYLIGREANLRGANFYGANFNSVDCTLCDFTGANLSTANFGTSNLTGARLTNANLGTAMLSRADLRYVSSGGIGALPALPQNWTVIKGYLVGPTANLCDADLSGASVSTSLEGANLRSANLSNATITGSMQNAEIFGANLTDVDLSASSLKGLSQGYSKSISSYILGDTTGTPKALPNGWVEVKGILLGPGVKVQFGDLASSDLSNLDLTGAYFDASNLSNSNLSGTKLTNSSLQRSNFSGSNLSSADLTGTNLADVNFSNADLSDASLADAQLTYSNLDDVKLDFTDLDNLASRNLSGAPSLPDLWALQNGYLIGPGANLTNARLGGASLNGVSLEGATLTGMRPWDPQNSKGISGAPVALPQNWILDRSGILAGPGVDLFGADLTNKPLATWNLAGASLAGANISGSDVYGADFSSVTLSVKNPDQSMYGVKGCDLNGGVTLPPKWRVVGGCLLGPGADVSDQNLAGLDLSGLDLFGANFRGANLYMVTTSRGNLGANFEGANFANANLTDADLSYSDLDKADISFANLTRTNLSNSSMNTTYIFPKFQYASSRAPFNQTIVQNITGSPIMYWSGYLVGTYKVLRGNLVGPNLNLSNANLIGVDFSGVDLTGSTITSARLNSVSWGNSKCPDGVLATAHVDGSCLKDVMKYQTLQPTPSISGTPAVGNTVCAEPGTWEDGVTFNYDWGINAQPIGSGVKTRCYTIQANDVTKNISVVVTGKKYGYYDAITMSAGLTVVPGTIPSNYASGFISGTFKNGNTLTFSSGPAFLGLYVPTVTSWLRDGQPIPTSPSSTYTLTQSDIGKKISVSYQITANGYMPLNATTAQTTPIAGADLTLTPVPSILGTVKSGSRLTAAPGQWNAGVTFTYQWVRNGTPISGATSSTYTLTRADIGQNISVTVTGSLAGYTSVSKTSVTVKPLSIKATR